MSIAECYTDETLRNTDGKDYQVLDTSKIKFDGPEVKYGKKVAKTTVRKAKPGEEIITMTGTEECRFKCKGDEAIFINSATDIFVPRDANNQPNGWQILSEKYTHVSSNPETGEYYFVPKGPPMKILHEAIDRPTCIKDVWGPGIHHYITAGGTLKQESPTRITAIDKEAFDLTWAFTDMTGRRLDNGDTKPKDHAR